MNFNFSLGLYRYTIFYNIIICNVEIPMKMYLLHDGNLAIYITIYISIHIYMFVDIYIVVIYNCVKRTLSDTPILAVPIKTRPRSITTVSLLLEITMSKLIENINGENIYSTKMRLFFKLIFFFY